MKRTEKIWKKIISVMLVLAVIVTMVPASVLASYSYEAATVGLDVSEVTLEKNVTDSQEVNVSYVANADGTDEVADGDISRIDWATESSDVISITTENDDKSKSATITAKGAGKAEVTVTATYTEDEVEKTSTGTVVVEVYETPTITIVAEPNSSSATYPAEVKFTATASNNATPELVITKDGNLVEYTMGERITLTPGEYEVNASLKADDDRYYKAATAETLQYTVEKGKTEKVFLDDTQVYWNEEFSFVLPEQEAEGSYTVTVDNLKIIEKASKPGEVVKLKADGDINLDSSVTLDFVLSEEEQEKGLYEGFTSKIDVTVNRIPVIATWSNLTKVYDATTEFTTSTKPTYELDGISEYSGFVAPTDTVEGDYEFTLNVADVGSRTATLYTALALKNADYYALAVAEPVVSVEVTPVILDKSNVNSFVGKGKEYDGTSDAKFLTAPSLNNNNNKILDDMTDWEFSYTAKYFDAEGEEVYGSPDENTTAAKIVISELTIAGTKSENYMFSTTETCEVSEGYVIQANSDFEAFTGLELGETVDGVFWLNPTFWANEEDKGTIKVEGFKFAKNAGEGRIPFWAWEDEYTLSATPSTVYAKNTTTGLISKVATVAYDQVAPIGQFVVTIGENTTNKLNYFTAEYKIITSEKKVSVSFEGSDANSRVKTVEWCASDKAWSIVNELNQEVWEENAEDIITESFKSDGAVNIEKKLITDAKEMKKFYYAKVTDYAGNVSYVSSGGVLQDVQAPEVQITLKENVATYNDKAVYDEDVKFDIKLSDKAISSGVSKVELTLFGNGIQEQKWTSEDVDDEVLQWDEESKEKLTAMGALDSAKEPTNAQIEAANTGDTISATLKGLADCNYYTLKVVAYDKAGNVSTENVVEFIKDGTAPVVDIDIRGLEKVSDYAEADIYKGGTVVVTVKDMTLTTSDEDLFDTGITLDKALKEESTSATGLVTKTYRFTFGSEGKQYPEADYVIAVKAEDSVKNTNSDTDTKTQSFTIDYTAPKYTVTFSDTDASAYEGDTDTVYYNRDIVAAFKVDEGKTFKREKIIIEVKKDGQIITSGYESSFNAETNTYTIAIAADGTTDGVYTFAISGMDKAGNQLEHVKAEKDKVDVIRVMDATNPVLEDIEYSTKDVFNTVKDKDYVNADTEMTFTITEHNPITNKIGITSVGEDKADFTWEKEQGDTYSQKVTIPMNGALGDEQQVTLDIYDKAGNKAVLGEETKLRSEKNTKFNTEAGQFIDKFTVDTVIPEIYFEYEVTPTNKNVEGIDYFGGDTVVKAIVTVDEHNFDKGLFETIVEKIGEKLEYEETEWTTDASNNDKHTKVFTFTEDNQYDITITGTDNAKNAILLQEGETSATVSEDGTTNLSVALDKTLPSVGDATKPIVVITPETAPGKTVKGEDGKEQALYNTDVTYEVAIYDPLTNKYASGIDAIEITATGEDGTTVTSTINKAGNITNEKGLTIEKSKECGDVKNLAKGKENQYVYNVVISKEVFNTNGIVLSVKAVDVSKNVKPAEAEPIAIDTTAPEVTISYDNNDVSNDKYFHVARTATVRVQERNFSNDYMTFVVNNEEKPLEFKLVEKGDELNRDDAVWEATYTFSAEDDYVVSGSCVDRATNQGTVTFTGEAPQDFTLDYTKPIIGIEFDNTTAFNTNYYNANRVATITITEHNFRASDVQIIGTASDAGTSVQYPTISAWNSNGDVHKATLSFNRDARYTLDVTYSDLATNAADDVAEQVFTVDTVDPQINIKNVVNEEAYPDVISPAVDFSDNNYDRYEIKVTHTNKDEVIDVTDDLIGQLGVSVDATGKGVASKIIEDLAHEPEKDGIYKISITVSDKAGRSTVEEVTYSVNRFGTVYVYSPDLIDLLEGYHKQIEEDAELYIEAYNPDQLLADSTKLEITWDGAVLAGQKSNADISNSSNGDGWYKYVFNLEHEDFVQEGRYEITISDKDEAGNTRTNSDNPIGFYIDSNAPKLELVTGLEKKQVYGTEQKVTYKVSDTMGIGSIEIKVGEEIIKTITEFDNVNVFEDSFILGVGKRQKVQFIIKDKSGRVLDTEAVEFDPDYEFKSTITVSDNLFVLWYDNTILFWSTIALALIAIGGIILLIWKKKNKENEEEI